mmetsp:Transcript_67118/g.111607  ORF Transcript_67118/g.111607 Transcript_67118/m.111607 type:complete len:288 (-) Transcript_67118:136-999(-)
MQMAVEPLGLPSVLFFVLELEIPAIGVPLTRQSYEAAVSMARGAVADIVVRWVTNTPEDIRLGIRFLQFRKRAQCLDLVLDFERRSAVTFEHVVMTRPDLLIAHTVAPVRHWPTGHVPHVMTPYYPRPLISEVLRPLRMWDARDPAGSIRALLRNEHFPGLPVKTYLPAEEPAHRRFSGTTDIFSVMPRALLSRVARALRDLLQPSSAKLRLNGDDFWQCVLDNASVPVVLYVMVYAVRMPCQKCGGCVYGDRINRSRWLERPLLRLLDHCCVGMPFQKYLTSVLRP